MLTTYEYTVGNFQVNTREAARMIQRSLRRAAPEQKAPRIIQKATRIMEVR